MEINVDHFYIYWPSPLPKLQHQKYLLLCSAILLWCKISSALLYNPLITECNMIGVSCNCGSRSNACSGLANTACSTNSGACECDAASGLIDGQCIRVEGE